MSTVSHLFARSGPGAVYEPVKSSGGRLSAQLDSVEGTPGSAAPPKGALCGGQDASGNFQPLAVDSSGSLTTSPPASSPKSLRQLRSEGKCFVTNGTKHTLTSSLSLNTVFNPPGSGNKLGVYEISWNLSSNSTQGRVPIFVSLISGVPVSGNTSNDGFNVKAGAPNDTESELYKELGGSPTTLAGLIRSQFRMQGGSNNLARHINYQEEMIELPEGTGIEIFTSGNNVNNSIDVSAQIRYVKVGNTEPL